MKYVAVLGRQPQLSLAELQALFGRPGADYVVSAPASAALGAQPPSVRLLAPQLAEFQSDAVPNIWRLGGTLKIAVPIPDLAAFLAALPPSGKLTLGLSDFSPHASARTAQQSALRLKRQLAKAGRSVRVVPNQSAVLSSATSLHNHLFQPQKIELLQLRQRYYRVIALANPETYARRDRARPARDARVGMLPPKLAQILINLCGNLPAGTRLLDPFCGTGVLLQEALLMGYSAYGTDLSERMVSYAQRNLAWLLDQPPFRSAAGNSAAKPAGGAGSPAGDSVAGASLSGNSAAKAAGATGAARPASAIFACATGDATDFHWQPPLGAVACETYLGPPLSAPPADLKLRAIMADCQHLLARFLANLAPQLASGTPVVLAIPAWLRPDGSYARLPWREALSPRPGPAESIDNSPHPSYNVISFSHIRPGALLYYRPGQIVAREILVLRKV